MFSSVVVTIEEDFTLKIGTLVVFPRFKAKTWIGSDSKSNTPSLHLINENSFNRAYGTGEGRKEGGRGGCLGWLRRLHFFGQF